MQGSVAGFHNAESQDSIALAIELEHARVVHAQIVDVGRQRALIVLGYETHTSIEATCRMGCAR